MDSSENSEGEKEGIEMADLVDYQEGDARMEDGDESTNQEKILVELNVEGRNENSSIFRANADPVRNHVAQYDDNDATKKALKSVANKQAK